MTRCPLALLALLALGCERESTPDDAPAEAISGRGRGPNLAPNLAALDLGAIRVAIVDGLEAAARDPGVAEQLDFAGRFESPELEVAIERLLARTTANAELTRIADAFFLALQDSPAMRAALLEHARQHPELVDADLGALRESFVADVERRLTRKQLAVLLEQQLRAALQASDEALVQAWLSEAGGASALASAVLARLEDPEFRATLEGRLGRDGLQSVLVRRLAEPKRAAELLLGVGPKLGSPDRLAAIVDDQRTAELLAGALGRALQDEHVRARCAELFALALATELDASEFSQTLSRTLDEPALLREAGALARAVAREPIVQDVVARELDALAANSAQFDALLGKALD